MLTPAVIRGCLETIDHSNPVYDDREYYLVVLNTSFSFPLTSFLQAADDHVFPRFIFKYQRQPSTVNLYPSLLLRQLRSLCL